MSKKKRSLKSKEGRKRWSMERKMEVGRTIGTSRATVYRHRGECDPPQKRGPKTAESDQELVQHIQAVLTDRGEVWLPW